MAEREIMNTGWNRGAFRVPKSSNSITALWPQDLVQGYEKIFDLGWVQGGRGLFRFSEHPLVQRERGVPAFGGIYEHVALKFVPNQGADIPRRVLQMGLDNPESPIEPHALSVTVHSGVFEVEDMHWIEFYDPTRFQRVRMSPEEFKAYAHNLSVQAQNIARETYEAAYKRGPTDGYKEYHRIYDFKQEELISSGMLLASFFAPKRVPLHFLLRLRLAFPTFDSFYKCVSELPDDGSADQIPVHKLVLLYGEG